MSGRAGRARATPAGVGLGAGALTTALVVLTTAAIAAQDPLPEIRATAHPPVPAQPAAYWLAPAAPSALTTALKNFARAVTILDEGGDALSVAPLLSAAALESSVLADHGRYYRGIAAQRSDRLDEAAAAFEAVAASTSRSWVVEQALWRLAEVHELQGRYAAAAEAYGRLLAGTPADAAHAHHQRGVALERSGDPAGSVLEHRAVYYDFPLSPDSDASGDALKRLDDGTVPFDARLAKVQARADALFRARRWSPARAAYADLAAATSGDVHAGADVRIAGADVRARQYRLAVNRLRPYLAEGAHQAEARMYYALALRGLGSNDAYVKEVGELAASHGDSPYAEEALNDMAVWYVRNDEDEEGARVFTAMVRMFPAGRFAERAAWKAGWWAYRHGDMATAVAHFETGARNFPRSDYRPAWLYWSGRAKQRMGDSDGGAERLTLTAVDYHNTYYGRLALANLGAQQAAVPKSPFVGQAGARAAVPPTERQIRTLMALGLNDLAIEEVQFARRVWGDSPALMATSALAHHRAGRLRLGINAMKRAYPQYMAAGGEELPADVLRVIFPAGYFQQLVGSAKRRGLDPYLVVALAAQESTFDAGIKSSAGAIGLMQIMPATGRSVARQLGIKRFTTRRLTDPETNMTIGTKYFSDLVQRFGEAAYALAGYNAGAHRVVRWRAERPGLPLDEWIDDIPFPETQNYVKRILGTADDYRRLYGGGILTPDAAQAASAEAPPAPRATPAPPRSAPASPARTAPRHRPGA
ncbi:MAG: lytic transglycosylase domain-containing protein [Vicinamibacterales bacterium]